MPSNLGVAALSPDGSVVALAGRNYEGRDAGKPIIVLWRWADDRPLYRVDGSADHLAFTPDGRSLVGASRDGNAHVWDSRNGTLRETIRVCGAGHFAIRDIAIAPDSRHFAAALGNGTARVIGSARMSPGCSPMGYGKNDLETIMPVPGNDPRNSLAIV